MAHKPDEKKTPAARQLLPEATLKLLLTAQ
jgi:hypothetical protein